MRGRWCACQGFRLDPFTDDRRRVSITGYKGPLVEGSLMVDGDAQTVVDDALLRMSDILGPETNGVHIRIAISVAGGPAQKLREFSFEGAGSGAALWEATH